MRKSIRLQLQNLADPFRVFVENNNVALVDTNIDGSLIDERARNKHR
jgi:hypothetical protein